MAIANNDYAAASRKAMGSSTDDAVAFAVLALAKEQHDRNRLAAITADHRGLALPPDLRALVNEGFEGQR